MLDQLFNKWVIGCLLSTVYIVYTAFSFYRNHVIIKRLGGRAPKVRGFLPWGESSGNRRTRIVIDDHSRSRFGVSIFIVLSTL